MLRAKQITNLSNSARSFFVSGSRCGTAEGSSCSCSEDETCIPRRQQPRNDAPVVQKPPTLVSTASAKAGAFASAENVKLRPSHEVDNIPQAVSTSPTLRAEKSGLIKYAADADVSGHSSSPQMSDQLFRAGIVAVNFLNDLVNCKIALSDGSGALTPSSQKYMVDPSRPVANVKPSNVKTVRRERFQKVHQRPSTGSSNCSSHYNARDYKGDTRAGKSNSEGFKGFNDTGTGNSVKKSVFSDAPNRRTSILQRPKTYSNNFLHSNPVQVPETRVAESFAGSVKDARTLTGIVSNPRQFANTASM
ncbi:hypothetical protein CRG98_001650, partial [Punica granatum]